METITAAIEYHLTCNHYPPVPLSMVPVCEAAIDLAIAEDWSEHVALPEGITWRGQDSAPAWAIIEAHHLDCFVEQSAYDEGEWDAIYTHS